MLTIQAFIAVEDKSTKVWACTRDFFGIYASISFHSLFIAAFEIIDFFFSCVIQAALLALRAGGNLQEQEGVEVQVEEPENRGNGCTHESEARQSNTNFKSVKVEPGAPENDAAHRDTSKIDDYPSKCIISYNARLNIILWSDCRDADKALLMKLIE